MAASTPSFGCQATGDLYAARTRLVRPHSVCCAEGASFSATPGFKWLVFVCPMCVTDFSDFCGYSSHRLHPLFPLLSFQLGFSGIPVNDEKTSKSYLRERYTRTPFWNPFFTLFSEKVPFFPRKVRPLFASLRRNPARRVNLVILTILRFFGKPIFCNLPVLD